MSDLFVGSFTSYLAGEPDNNPSDGTLPDLDGAFDFVEPEHDLDAPQPTGTSRQQSPRGYETPTPSDGGWLASQGMRPAITVVSSDDEQDDPQSDTSVDSDDDTADEMGDAGVAQDTTSEWKIDHSSGDHRLHGRRHELVEAQLTLSSTGFHREDRIQRIRRRASRRPAAPTEHDQLRQPPGRIVRSRPQRRVHPRLLPRLHQHCRAPAPAHHAGQWPVLRQCRGHV